MTIAEIHGKWQSEDLLTANVFTAFRYLPADQGIVNFLRSIRRLDDIIPEPNEAVSCEFHFWPQGRYREPDLLLELYVDGHCYHVLIEAKYFSGPSDTDLVEVEEGEDTVTLGNQLADQFRGLQHGEYAVYQGALRNGSRRLKSRKEDRVLLYLTAHPMRPKQDIQRAAKILVREFPDAPGRLFWVSWYDVFDHLESMRSVLTDFPYPVVIEDICSLLRRKGFASFQGFSALPSFVLVKGDGSFWLDIPVEYGLFAGMGLPPQIEIAIGNGSFWSGYRDDIFFHGFKPLPVLNISRNDGSFLLKEATT
jgi:hypothetical protein